MQHQIVPQTRGAVNPDQDAVFQGGAETNGQPVCPGARPLVGWPVEQNEASSFAKDVRGPSWAEEMEKYKLRDKQQQESLPNSKTFSLSEKMHFKPPEHPFRSVCDHMRVKT